MTVTNVNQTVYEQVLNKYFDRACELFYDSDKFDCKLSERRVNKFIRLLYVYDKKDKTLYAVCILSITYDQLPSLGLNFKHSFLSSVRQENQSEITNTDIALFQIDPQNYSEKNRVHFTISEPIKTYPAWSISNQNSIN